MHDNVRKEKHQIHNLQYGWCMLSYFNKYILQCITCKNYAHGWYFGDRGRVCNSSNLCLRAVQRQALVSGTPCSHSDTYTSTPGSCPVVCWPLSSSAVLLFHFQGFPIISPFLRPLSHYYQNSGWAIWIKSYITPYVILCWYILCFWHENYF